MGVSFIKVDDLTSNKERLDVAKILVRVESKLVIPSVIKVCINELSYKIAISLEEEDVVLNEEEGIDDVVERNVFAAIGPDSATSQRSEEFNLVYETLGEKVERSQKEFSSHLSEEELIGGQLAYRELILLSDSLIVPETM
ncbi:hypothetical protein PTKIN_Ptkin14bG0045500 [Pterospermum kingtungense]